MTRAGIDRASVDAASGGGAGVHDAAPAPRTGNAGAGHAGRAVRERAPVLQMVRRAPREASLGDRFLDAACAAAPALGRILQHHGHRTVGTYLATALRVQRDSLQDRGDLVDEVARYTASLLGPEAAASVRADLEASPVVLTGNHHGVDFFAQSVLGSLVFSRRGGAQRSVPILACGSVAMNNLTYPLGMLMYDVAGSELSALPRKLPVFSNRVRRDLVCSAAPFDETLIRRAQGRLAKMHRQGEIADAVQATAHEVLADDYGAPEVLSLSSYSDQAVVLNRRIWRRLFADPDSAPEMTYLEVERIARSLLVADLADADSLASQVFFVPGQRERLVRALDGVRACWQRSGLARRIENASRGENPGHGAGGCGTLFFWGVVSGRRVPLTLEDGALTGVDDHGHGWRCEFTPDALTRELEAGRLLPSTFTSYLVIALARGVTCVGGYYQVEYLPAIQGAVVDALQSCGWTPGDVGAIADVPTDVYLSGMQPVVHQLASGAMVPAGVMEIIAAGGLSPRDLARLRDITVRDAHAASLLETLPDLAVPDFDQPGVREALAADCARRLAPGLVTLQP